MNTQHPTEPTWSPAFLRHLEHEVLPQYLPRCRWFGGKGRAIQETRVVHCLPIGAQSAARFLVVEVVYADGVPESYLVPLALAQCPEPAGFVAPGICDALFIPEIRAELLRFILQPTPVSAIPGLAGSSDLTPEPAEIEGALAGSRILSSDHSNSSIAFGDSWFLKLYRRFEHGPNPDLELTRLLTKEAKACPVPAYCGALELVDEIGKGAVGMLTALIPYQGDGWTYSLNALSDFFDRVLANKSAVPDSFIARQLGRRTAEMHLLLASIDGGFSPEPFTADYQHSLCETMRTAAGLVLPQLHQLPSEHRRRGAALLARKEEIIAAFSGLLDHEIRATKIRIHGDFHLGQVLKTMDDFVIIDFEGEPQLSIEQRRQKQSPLRDVAGMLRSFDYAAAVALGRRPAHERERLRESARGWVESVSRSFLSAYFKATEGAAFLPKNPADTQMLLEMFVLSKALYELGYEMRHRPEMVGVPLEAVERLLEKKPKRDVRAPRD